MAEAKGILVNLISGNEANASKAFRIATRLVKTGKVSLVHANIDAVKFCTPKNGEFIDPVMKKPLSEVMKDYIAAGGRIIVGKECMGIFGIGEDEVYEGFELSTPDVLIPLLLDSDIKVVTW